MDNYVELEPGIFMDKDTHRIYNCIYRLCIPVSPEVELEIIRKYNISGPIGENGVIGPS